MMEGYLKTGDLMAASELVSVMKQEHMELSKKQQRMFIEICIMANDVGEAIRRLRVGTEFTANELLASRLTGSCHLRRVVGTPCRSHAGKQTGTRRRVTARSRWR
jgi:hypothetical protein